MRQEGRNWRRSKFIPSNSSPLVSSPPFKSGSQSRVLAPNSTHSFKTTAFTLTLNCLYFINYTSSITAQCLLSINSTRALSLGQNDMPNPRISRIPMEQPASAQSTCKHFGLANSQGTGP